MNPSSFSDRTFAVLVLRHDAVMRVALLGDVDVSASSELEQLVAAVRSTGVREVEVDVSGVSFMDSSGCKLLAGLARAVPLGRAGVHVVGSSAHVRHLLELTGFADVVLDELPPREPVTG